MTRTAPAAAAALAALTVLAPLPAATAAPGPAAVAVRESGPDRVATALAVTRDRDDARNLYGAPEQPSVVIASADACPDALAAAALADRFGAPLLLTRHDALDPRVAAELRAHLPAGATVRLLGGTSALSPAVADAITAGGWRVERVAGEDRYATAAAVAAVADTDPSHRDVILSTGADFPDALVGGTYGVPVLLTAPGVLPPATEAALAQRRGSVRHLVVVGGPRAVSDAVMARAADLLGATVVAG